MSLSSRRNVRSVPEAQPAAAHDVDSVIDARHAVGASREGMSDISNLGCHGAVELHHAVVYFHAQTARPACPRVIRERGPNPGFDDGIASVAVSDATHGRDRSQTTAPVNRRSGQK